MDFAGFIALIGTLASIVGGATEWFKSWMDVATWDDWMSDEMHKVTVQLFAFVVGAGVCIGSNTGLVHFLNPETTLQPMVDYIATGVALALPADFLKTGLQWAKAARDAKNTTATGSGVVQAEIKATVGSNDTPPPEPKSLTE